MKILLRSYYVSALVSLIKIPIHYPFSCKKGTLHGKGQGMKSYHYSTHLYHQSLWRKGNPNDTKPGSKQVLTQAAYRLSTL